MVLSKLLNTCIERFISKKDLFFEKYLYKYLHVKNNVNKVIFSTFIFFILIQIFCAFSRNDVYLVNIEIFKMLKTLSISFFFEILIFV